MSVGNALGIFWGGIILIGLVAIPIAVQNSMREAQQPEEIIKTVQMSTDALRACSQFAVDSPENTQCVKDFVQNALKRGA